MSFIEENRGKIQVGLKKYFDEMVKVIYAYEIPFIEYKGYVTHLENAILHDFIDNYMYYVVVLFNAEVLVDESDVREYTMLQTYLENVITFNTEEALQKNGIEVSLKFKELVELLKNCTISLDKYSEYCELFKACLIVDDDNIDYDGIAKALIDVEVKMEDTYQNNLKYYNYQVMLRSHLASVNKNKEI